MNNPGFSISDKGQAMAEYAIITALVIVVSVFGVSSGWFDALKSYLFKMLYIISLPIP